MNEPPLQPRLIPPRPHCTETVSREEILARREKFWKIGWLLPNHKPKMKKVIATAKRLWDKYVICGCRLCLRGVTVRTADGVLSGIVSILVSMPIHTFWKASISTALLGRVPFVENHSLLNLHKRQHHTTRPLPADPQLTLTLVDRLGLAPQMWILGQRHPMPTHFNHQLFTR
jgi:hypothetical protein